MSPQEQLSSPMMSLAQAKAVLAMCPKSIWLLPSSRVAHCGGWWQFRMAVPLVPYGHLIILCSKQKLPMGIVCSSSVTPSPPLGWKCGGQVNQVLL